MYKSKRSQATDIPKDVRDSVKERDGFRCVMCGSTARIELAHVILSRSNGGLGIEENLACLCQRCHRIMDGESKKGKKIRRSVIHYLENFYGRIDINGIKYKKRIQ